MANAIYELPWQIRVSGIFLARSGFPYTGLVGFDADGDGLSGGTYGDRPASLERNSFRMDSFYNFDLSAAKSVSFGGRHEVEVRLDVFNVFNTPNMIGVNSALGLDPANPPAAFGTKTSWSSARQAQLAIRYRF